MPQRLGDAANLPRCVLGHRSERLDIARIGEQELPCGVDEGDVRRLLIEHAVEPGYMGHVSGAGHSEGVDSLFNESTPDAIHCSARIHDASGQKSGLRGILPR